MSDLLAARLQMAVSLGFHIIFACIGMAMPFFMAFSEWRWLKTGQEVYLNLTKAWSRGVAIFFATGAVSGTVLSFELGLLWPKFMEEAGPIFGMPFSWEGTAFFIEAIALGLFLYGWDKLNKWTHWVTGLVVGISGTLSAVFVMSANAWMNAPEGFDWVNGEAVNVDPVDAMFNAAWLSETMHMTLAAFVSTGFAVAGVHAILLLGDRGNLFHRKALKISLAFATVAALLQPISGDYSAKDVADRQPAKFAAIEGQFETEKSAGLTIGGIPDPETKEMHYGFKIPGLLSFLAHGDFSSEVKGLEEFPREHWPPITVVHIAFQIMVGLGFFMAGVGLLYLWLSWKRREKIFSNWFLKLVAVTTPLGFIALEAGWVVTEVGRQPWIIYKFMTVEESLTPMPGITYIFILVTGIYLLLTVVITWLMIRQFRAIPKIYIDDHSNELGGPQS